MIKVRDLMQGYLDNGENNIIKNILTNEHVCYRAFIADV